MINLKKQLLLIPVGILLLAVAIPSNASGTVYGNVGYHDYPWSILIGYNDYYRGHRNYYGGDYCPRPYYRHKYHHKKHYHRKHHHRKHYYHKNNDYGHRKKHYYRDRHHYRHDRHHYKKHHKRRHHVFHDRHRDRHEYRRDLRVRDSDRRGRDRRHR